MALATENEKKYIYKYIKNLKKIILYQLLLFLLLITGAVTAAIVSLLVLKGDESLIIAITMIIVVLGLLYMLYSTYSDYKKLYYPTTIKIKNGDGTYYEDDDTERSKRYIGSIELVLPIYWINYLPNEFKDSDGNIKFTYFSLEDAFHKKSKMFKAFHRKNLLLSYNGNKVIDRDFKPGRSPVTYMFSTVTNIIATASVVITGIGIETQIYEPLNNLYTKAGPVVYTNIIFPAIFVFSAILLAVNIVLFIIKRYWKFKFALEVGSLNTSFYNFMNPFLGWN
ncbi:MAG: hypothetical protein GY754_29155 [bacterium]|nr:hypothetical protein [bacterium]